MEKLKLVAHTVTEDLNREHSTIIGIFEKGTDWLFKIILILGIPFFLFVIGNFLRL